MLVPFKNFGLLALATVVAVGLALPAAAQQAQPPAKEPTAQQLAAARTVLEVTGGAKAFNAVIPQLLQDARTTLLSTRPDIRSDIDQVVLGLTSEFIPREAELVTNLAKVYATTFSEAELNQIVTFYKSPVGQKFMQATPEVMRQSYAMAQEWGGHLSTDIMNRVREELKKRGHDI